MVVRARGREEPPRARRYAVLAGVLLLAYLAAPYSVNFGAYLYVRFLAPAFAVAVLAAAPSVEDHQFRVPRIGGEAP